MPNIHYYIAISLDGYISGENGDIGGFLGEGKGIQKYLSDLNDYETVIMGRNTYEFGYQYGLKPGDLAYPHMDHFIFSDTLSIEGANDKLSIKKLELDEIKNIRANSNTDVYLCGGGMFAGWLLEHEQIDVLKLKINPLVIGKGVRLFGDYEKRFSLKLIDTETYEDGLLINTYEIVY